MIVVDTTVWVDHLRDTRTAGAAKLREIIAGDLTEIVVGDLLLCEVLQGLTTERDAVRIERMLLAFEVVPMTGVEIAVKAAANYRRLRALGITVRKTIDMLIGTFCIERGYGCCTPTATTTRWNAISACRSCAESWALWRGVGQATALWRVHRREIAQTSDRPSARAESPLAESAR